MLGVAGGGSEDASEGVLRAPVWTPRPTAPLGVDVPCRRMPLLRRPAPPCDLL